MTRETAEKLIENVFASLNDHDSITFAFQGGEPLLAGLSFYGFFIEVISQQTKKVTVSYALQTNGLALDDEWCAFFKKHNFLIGLSLDGPLKYHDKYRLNPPGKGTYRDVQKAKALLEKHSVPFNVLTVLTNELARHPQEMWSFILKHRIGYIQFIPCLNSLDNKHKSPYALTPPRFASFYTALFALWKDALEKNNYISVKLFDDLIALLTDGVIASCGMNGRCQPQFVAEADGSVYPCDFYCVDEYCLGSLCELSLKELFETNVMQGFLTNGGVSLPQCGGCKYVSLCGGYCKRMRSAMCADIDGLTCGYRSFLDGCLADLIFLVKHRRIGGIL
jgi:uncharacterized protein